MPRTRPNRPSPKSAQTKTSLPDDPLAAFRARLASGRFGAVLGHALRRTMRDAAADPGLDAEVAAIRLGLARLLNEEPDPSKLAAGIARLAAVAVQAARLRHPANPEMDAIHFHLLRELDAIEAEQAAEQAALAASPLPLPAATWHDSVAPFSATESPSPCAQGEGLG